MVYENHELLGRLTRDVALTYSQQGKAVAKFGLATNPTKNRSTFYNVTVFEETAEACARHLSKGDTVLITSNNISASAYINKSNNQPSASLEVIAHGVRFISTKKPPPDSDPDTPPDDAIPF